ncbi:MAG TPA: DUF6600 domain-containing protein, partial [Kofleriaceae bacterium]|nr:DUF6600 domain-containing protein [Kofleriaceae bacterium]
MTIGKLCLAAFLCAMPAMAIAQPSVGVNVGVNANVNAEDSYDTTAPGDPVESVDVFYDQLSPYGMWVDEPDVGRVFVPQTDNYVPYTNGHWQYTNLGFVWTSNEPHAWATAHYGRWAYSNNYGRWYWSPDTQWGPAWVDWRQTGTHFGWAPLAPEVVVRAGWHVPVESWHYCGSEHVLDVNVTRYYEPRARVIEIHRDARPMEHYSTVSNVRVVVGPSSAVLRDHRVTVRPVRVEARAIGRWSPVEAHAQVERAHEHQATFEVQNQHRIEGNARIHTAQVKVIETHPQIKAQINVRVQGSVHVGEPGHTEPGRPGEPNHVEPGHTEPGHTEPARPGQPAHTESAHEPNKPGQPAHAESAHEPNKPGQPAHAESAHEPNKPG